MTKGASLSRRDASGGALLVRVLPLCASSLRLRRAALRGAAGAWAAAARVGVVLSSLCFCRSLQPRNAAHAAAAALRARRGHLALRYMMATAAEAAATAQAAAARALAALNSPGAGRLLARRPTAAAPASPLAAALGRGAAPQEAVDEALSAGGGTDATTLRAVVDELVTRLQHSKLKVNAADCVFQRRRAFRTLVDETRELIAGSAVPFK